MLDRVRSAAESLARRWMIKRARCYKACFLDGAGAHLTYEGERVLADLRDYARLGTHSFLRDRELRIDPLAMARIEGRREILRRILDHIDLDENAVRKLVEVRDE